MKRLSEIEKFKRVFGSDVIGEVEGIDDRVIVRGASGIALLIRKDVELEWIKSLKKYSLVDLPRVKSKILHYFVYDNNVYNYGAFVRKAIDAFFDKSVKVGIAKHAAGLNLLTFELPESYLVICPILDSLDMLSPEKVVKFEDIFRREKMSKGFFSV